MKPQQNERRNAGSIVAQSNKDRDALSATLQSTEKLAKRANKEFTVATYNVRTLNNSTTPEVTVTHKLERKIVGCEENNISILAIQEHRLKTDKDLNYEKHGDWTLIHTNSSHDCHGVAILLSKQIAQIVSTATRKSNRIIVLHLLGNPKICFISAYAPTETASESTKDEFYEDLNEVLTSIPRHTIIILAGDLKARLGKDSRSTNSRVIGNDCYHEFTNENGQRLIDLCDAMDLRPTNTHFANRRSRLSTYKDPNGNYFQLDHIMINMKWWKSIKNCRSYNTIDIMSDHKILSANFKLSLRATKREINPRRLYMVEKLANRQIQKDFNIELKNHFDALFDENDPSNRIDEVQKRSEALYTALEETCDKVLGKRPKNKHPSWVSQVTLDLIKEQGQAKAKYKNSQLETDKLQWRTVQNQVSVSFAYDQTKYEEEQLKALEIADEKHECGTTWKIIEKLTKKPQDSPAGKVRMLDGSILKDPKKRLDEWCKYFSNLLNNKNKNFNIANLPDPAPTDNNMISTKEMSRDEIVLAIKELKRGKSPGPDHAMTAEVLKDGGEFIC